MREGLSDGVELISGVIALIFGGVFCLARAGGLRLLQLSDRFGFNNK